VYELVQLFQYALFTMAGMLFLAGGFACCIAIKKESAAKASPIAEGADPATATISSGGWNSIHVVEARVSESDSKCRYKLTTTGPRLYVWISSVVSLAQLFCKLLQMYFSLRPFHPPASSCPDETSCDIVSVMLSLDSSCAAHASNSDLCGSLTRSQVLLRATDHTLRQFTPEEMIMTHTRRAHALAIPSALPAPPSLLSLLVLNHVHAHTHVQKHGRNRRGKRPSRTRHRTLPTSVKWSRTWKAACATPFTRYCR